MMFFYQTNHIINLFKENENPERMAKVFAAVAHITSVEESKNPEKGAEKIERLGHNNRMALLTSFAHCDLTIAIPTLPNRNVTGYLPEYQIKCIQI